MKANQTSEIDTRRRLSVGEVANRSGVSIATLHFYEQVGLISSERSRGNHRQYARDILRRVAVIKVAQRAGISLSEIAAALASLPDARTLTANDWSRLSRQWKQNLDARIAELSKLRDQLAGCIGCGCLSLKACNLRNPGDKLGTDGSGARLL